MNNKSLLSGTGLLLPKKYFSKQAFATPFASEYRKPDVVEASGSDSVLRLNGKPVIFTFYNGVAVPLTMAAKKQQEMVFGRGDAPEALENVVDKEVRLLDMFGRDLRTAPDEKYPVGTIIGVDGNPLSGSAPGKKGYDFKLPSAALPLIAILGFAGLNGACKKHDDVPVPGRGNVILLGEGPIATFDYVEGATMELKASNYPGADASHIIVRKPGMGGRLAFDNVDGIVNVTISKDGADVILCRAGSRYSGVENGKLRYGRRPTWNWISTSYTPTSEEINFVESTSDEFSSYLSSESGLNLGSLTKVSGGDNILQAWGYLPGGPYASRTGNAIGYNAAEMRPNTAIGRAVVHEELLEMLIGLDDIFGRDTYKDLCDSSGNPTREYKDLLFYVFAKEN